MKKLLALILALALCMPLACALAETEAAAETEANAKMEANVEVYDFTASMSKENLEIAPEDLKESGIARALFSVILDMDYEMAAANDGVALPFEPNLLVDVSYVGLDGTVYVLLVISEGNGKASFLAYDSETGVSTCVTSDIPEDAEGLLAQRCPDGYWKNNPEEVYQVYVALLQKINSSGE